VWDYLCGVKFATSENLLFGGGIGQRAVDGVKNRQFEKLISVSDRGVADDTGYDTFIVRSFVLPSVLAGINNRLPSGRGGVRETG
jgi:hypothetical protein